MRHVLRTSAGFEVELFLDEPIGDARCRWSPIPTTAAEVESVAAEYRDIGVDGEPTIAEFNP